METTGSVSIDGFHLLFPGTGLSLVTAEWIRAMTRLRPDLSLSVFIPERVDLAGYHLDSVSVNWIRVAMPELGPDYLFRWIWGRKVAHQLKSLRRRGRHLIPYLYNYGAYGQNVVLIPDFVYRLFPDYGPRPGQPWWDYHGRLPLRPIVRWLEERWVAHAARWVVYSQYIGNQSRELLGIPADRITVVPLAPPDWITSDAVSRKEVGAPLPARFVLYVGGYAARKNIPMILRACARIHQKEPSFRCVFAGLTKKRLQGDPQFSGISKEILESEAIVCLPDVKNPELRSLYERCYFSIYPSHSEGFGLPILEAAACGRICLCGDNSSMKEIQSNPDYRVDASNESAWVERILHLWNHPALVDATAKDCKELAAKYSWEESAQKVLETLLT